LNEDRRFGRKVNSLRKSKKREKGKKKNQKEL
jgi:hypothetical protein